ncbi:MAG: MscL family protein [Patescibacteria group bacterium]
MATTEKKSVKKADKARDITTKAITKVTGDSKKHVNGFFDFIRSQGVVGLAIGLAIGVAAGDTVKKIVEGFINPVVQFIVGSQDALVTATWTFEAWGREATFFWGAALSSLITLVATALVIYWLVNIFRLDKLDKKKD